MGIVSAADTPGLAERLAAGPVICAEGYLFELERRGYVQAGAFVPEVVLEHPDEVLALHRAFVRAGSDIVQAFTYYAHRAKLRGVGKEALLAPLNREGLALARQVADETGTLMAGDICNTTIYDPADPGSRARVRAMFEEQIGWTLDAGADLVVGETFSYVEEALIALEAIRESGLPAVVTLAVHRSDLTPEGHTAAEACRRLAGAGADVVGLNCARGPATMLPLLADIVAAVDVPVAALPVPYRTHPHEPNMQSLTDPARPGVRPFPTGLDPFTCTRDEIGDFTLAAAAHGVRYLGLCCGAAPHHVRAMAEALGRTPPASGYSPDMSRHVYLGSRASGHNRAFRGQL